MPYYPAGGQNYTLGASISSTTTSITLSSFTIPVSGTLITMAVLETDIAYGALDPKTTSSEFISFTGITQNANGTATLTGVTRGLNKVRPFTGGATYRLPHSGQSVFILSDVPQVFAEYAALKNANIFIPVQEFTLLPTSSGGNAINNNQLVTYAQVLAMATGTTNINRVVVAGKGGDAITAGQLLYLLVTDGEWYLCDADTAATVDNIILGIAQGAGSNGVAITSGVLLFGLDSNQTGLTNNTAYYAGNTAGVISSTVGTVEVSVGISRSTTSLLFYPRYNQQITEDQQDALVGTSGTPSISNKYVTDADTTATPTANKVVRYSSDGATPGAGSAGIFGDGADGNVTIASGTTTISRDMYYNDLTIQTGGILNPSGYRVFVKGTLTFQGTGVIARNGLTGTVGGNGSAGSNGVGGGAGTAGAATAGLAAGSLSGSLGGSAGGNGGVGSNGSGAGAIGVVGTSASTLTNAVGSGSPAASNGVAGVNSTFNGGGAVTGALANAVTNPPMMPRNTIFGIPLHYFSGATIGYMAGSNLATGGSGGGGGGATAGGGGGGGGAGGSGGGCGGLVVVAAKAIVSVANNCIQAFGGTGGTGGAGGGNNGGSPGGTGGSGGTGGIGGVVVVVYQSFSGTAFTTAAVAGGTGGTGGTAGSGGSAGNTGTTGGTGVLYSIATV